MNQKDYNWQQLEEFGVEKSDRTKRKYKKNFWKHFKKTSTFTNYERDVNKFGKINDKI